MPALPDYFALYQISPTLAPDMTALRKKYYELSRQYHPDRFSTGDNAAQIEALRMSAQVNEGYRILNDEDARLGYVLMREGALEAEEHYKLPPEFLMEMMELNEAVGNAAMAPDMLPDAMSELRQALESWESGIAPLREQYNAGDHSPEILAALKDYYFRKKYLQRIKERLV
jgi:molecular chaperone HscB